MTYQTHASQYPDGAVIVHYGPRPWRSIGIAPAPSRSLRLWFFQPE